MHRTKPLVSIMCLVCWLGADALLSEARAQSYASWYQDGYTWRPGPNSKKVGSCFGNCGAGCSDRNDGNCIPDQYNYRMGWELDYLSDIVVSRTGEYEDCVYEGDSLPRLYRVTWTEYEVYGRYTYHGWVAAGCIFHDGTCPEWTVFGCGLFLGCGTQYGFKDWSYDTWLRAIKEYREAYGWGFGSC